ncbi:uncharacterized protein LAJ45_05620 [Morchella importuna]|uniref:Signal peptidase complex subunit 2 n=1 Tax=Morchella conica CCBAS932 TaxID=1392247 RepID=A0A3N4KX69_9PEZI|nr:uncharacterized protein LAJ45_05620 [Morchella importuna]KAH8150409.1 hypothetical protein LAJ45_05620 [Morchella importuna]RPB14019.1 microsomal signal peptidase 25 kDa subunit [Morchella conica CCBAS932]
METVPKVNINALPALKNTTDDMIAPYLKSLGYKQNHTLTDVRLVIGFAACAIAGVTFYYDWTAGFEAVKGGTLYAVIAYFILNTALTFWIWLVEGGTIYVGEKDGVKITISTHTEKHSPIYHMKITSVLPGTSGPHTVEEKSSFTNWFDEKGYFVAKPFKAFLQDSIPSLAAKSPEAIALKSKTKSVKS